MKNIYLPQPVKILEITDETADFRTFKLRFRDEKVHEAFIQTYKPGQFVEVSIFGVGECPISLPCTPTQPECFELSIKKIGAVTDAIHKLKTGDTFYVRGPYGNGFNLDHMKGKNLLFVGGGIGLAPLRGLIRYVFDNRDDYGNIIILYGARNPGELAYKEELAKWAEYRDTQVLISVDRGDESWTGNVGVVTTLCCKCNINAHNCVAFVCGPPIMIPFVIKELKKYDFPDEDIITTMERMMKCGVGKCGHCTVGHKYMCIDGPVFSFKELQELPAKETELSIIK